jgi:hypothetical protein
MNGSLARHKYHALRSEHRVIGCPYIRTGRIALLIMRPSPIEIPITYSIVSILSFGLYRIAVHVEHAALSVKKKQWQVLFC